MYCSFSIRSVIAPLLSLFAALACPQLADAQLRVVTYNTSGAPYGDMEIVLRSIGEENVNGIAKPLDILLLQEQSRSSGLPHAQAFVSLLNSMYSGQTSLGMPISYARGSLVGFGDTTQSIVYRTETVDLLGEMSIGTPFGSSPQPRATIRHAVRPDGYTSADSTLYIYNSHFKAGDANNDPNNLVRRETEAAAIRADSDNLGSAHIIYAGDFNLYTAAEPAFQTLLASGNGRAIDPLGLTDPTPDSNSSDAGDWHNNSAIDYAHTQSPCSSSNGGCGVGGGMDDRFDFQLVTEELDDGEGLSVIPGSYHAFGNGGGLCCGNSINVAGNSVTFSGVTSHTKGEILDALATVTDHIPVVVDYQVPAVMEALVGTVPGPLSVGQSFSLGVMVRNIANVVAAIGADELDYSLTTSGSLSGSFANQVDAALGGGNTHFVNLDTSTPGLKTGTITLTSSSQQVANGFIEIPVSYAVVSGNEVPMPLVVAQWTFEDTHESITGTAPDLGPIPPESGSGAARGHHASPSTWSAPSGNGSSESFSSNTWAAGDYYQFEVSTAGLEDISLEFDQVSSNTGPRDFGIFYSTTGEGVFTNTGLTYSVLANGTPHPSWNFSTHHDEYSFSFDLSSFAELEDADSVFLRLVSLSDVAANGGTVGSGGTSRVDNVTISGITIVGLPGDFNADGMVDAADYVVWRKENSGDSAAYATWRSHFGQSAGGAAASANAPEPGGWLLLAAAGACLLVPRPGKLAAWTCPR